jgi:hypothetical protein
MAPRRVAMQGRRSCCSAGDRAGLAASKAGYRYRMDFLQAEPSPDQLLAIYLKDHLMGATAGVELFRRSAKAQSDPAHRAALSRLAAQVAEDRESLKALMTALGVTLDVPRVVLGWVGEKVGRFKPNGTLLRRSPLSDLLELETMRLGVEGKACLWKVLERLASSDERLSGFDFERLLARAEAQSAELEELRLASSDALRA